MSDPKYAYPYPGQGYPQGYYQQPPPVVAPPQYAQAPPQRQTGFLEGWLLVVCSVSGLQGFHYKIWLLCVAAVCWMSAAVIPL
ncbi:protein CYSTEINE-RICH TRANSMEMBRANE MODULE 11 [Cryptomeria japonica]|uniref:protein CYSTEINE-RICH TRANSMEMBRANE MODULE 11 n=1 Tax=Cryptomeria japonica TaxID=3369 RepID=UPI0027D9E837|nr:protein CYSTEINE-RICH TRANSMEMBRANE MODULE 11 [Cryptomeria japonica]